MVDNNKKGFNYTVLFIVLFTILAVVILFFIWWPKSNTKENDLITYENVNGEDKSLELYKSTLTHLLNEENSNELFAKVNKEYLQSNNLNEKNFKEYMLSHGYISNNVIFISSTISKQDKYVYVYRIKYSVNGATKYVNVIEEFPYDYTLSFEQETIPIVTKNSFSQKVDDVIYKVSSEQIKEDSITYNLQITNKSDKIVKYNFDNVNDVILVLEDNLQVKLGAAIVSSDEDTLNTNGSLKKSLFFPIGSDYHNKIKYMILKSVNVDGNIKTVTISLK